MVRLVERTSTEEEEEKAPEQTAPSNAVGVVVVDDTDAVEKIDADDDTVA